MSLKIVGSNSIPWEHVSEVGYYALTPKCKHVQDSFPIRVSIPYMILDGVPFYLYLQGLESDTTFEVVVADEDLVSQLIRVSPGTRDWLVYGHLTEEGVLALEVSY